MRIRIDGLDRAVEQILELVRRLPCASVDLDDVDLALHEALANAVVHGNRQDPRKSVQICGGCERSGDLLLAIKDQGGGFDHNLVPDPTAGDNLLSKHGRGILLISRLMDSLEFRLNGRQLIMRKRAIRPPESPSQSLS
jgi:serine/threonine-protein kinase RsbW